MARRVEKVFNSLESGNFGLEEAAEGASYRFSDSNPPNHDLSNAPWFIFIPPRHLLLLDQRGLYQDWSVLAARSYQVSGPFHLAFGFNSAACGQLKKCETDSLIDKVVWEVKNWEIEFGSERYNFEAARGRSFEGRVPPVNRKLKHNGASFPSSSPAQISSRKFSNHKLVGILFFSLYK